MWLQEKARKITLLAWLLLLLITTTPPADTQVTSSLELLYENGLQVTSQHVVQRRVSIVYQLETDAMVSESFAKVRNVQKLWLDLKIFSTEGPLKTDLQDLLSVGSDYFSKAGGYLKHLHSFASDSTDTM